MNTIKLGKHIIGEGHRALIVAEMSGNHNQSLKKALEIVDAAANAGADAIKLQTYTPDTITLKGVHTIKDKNSIWYGKDLYDLYKQAYTPWEWHEPIIKRAKKKGLVWFSSPFDETSVDFLESLDIPFYKIASFENTHHPLIKKVAKTGKAIIMSTGVSGLSDIDESVRLLRKNDCNELVLLKCTSTYPASPEFTNLRSIPNMKDTFGCHIGLSDHTMGIGVSIASVALGAVVIEKHFCLSRKEGGVDSAFSLEPEELKSLVIEAERAFFALGNITYDIGSVERKSLLFKRSVYASADIKVGEKFTEKNIKVVRPGDGLHPKYYEILLNRKSAIPIKAGTPINIDALILLLRE
jgi:pseudaminic acid synthase